jgi:hypothetical protein
LIVSSAPLNLACTTVPEDHRAARYLREGEQFVEQHRRPDQHEQRDEMGLRGRGGAGRARISASATLSASSV